VRGRVGDGRDRSCNDVVAEHVLGSVSVRHVFVGIVVVHRVNERDSGVVGFAGVRVDVWYEGVT